MLCCAALMLSQVTTLGVLQALGSACRFSVSSPMFEFGRRSLFLCLPIFLPANLKGAKWFLKTPVVSTCISIKMLYRVDSLVFVIHLPVNFEGMSIQVLYV